MNNLQQLNTRGDQQFQFQDTRNSAIVFWVTTNTAQTFNYLKGRDHRVVPSLDIKDLIDAATIGLTFVFNVSDTNIAVVWDSIPAGVTQIDLGNNTWLFTGIDSVSDWQAVSRPLLNLPIDYIGTYTYSGTFNTAAGEQYVYTNTDVITDQNSITEPGASFYNRNSTQLITNTPRIQNVNNDIDFVLTITPSNSSLVSTLSSTGSAGATTSFNSSTKVYTISGNILEINSHLANLSLTSANVATSDLVLTYSLTDTFISVTDTITQTVFSTEYLSAGGASTYSFETPTAVTNVPLITNTTDDPLGALDYNIVISPDSTGKINTMTATGYPAIGVVQTVTFTFKAIFNNSLLAVGQTFSGFDYILSIYQRDDSTAVGEWSNTPVANIALPSGYETLVQPPQVYFNPSEDTMLIVVMRTLTSNGSFAYGWEILVYTGGGTVWTLDHIIQDPLWYPQGDGRGSFITGGRNIKFGGDNKFIFYDNRISSQFGNLGNAITSTHPDGPCVYVYDRATTTFSLFQTLASPEGVNDTVFRWISLLPNNIDISSDNNFIVIGDYQYPNMVSKDQINYPVPDDEEWEGKIYIYRLISSTYTLSQTIFEDEVFIPPVSASVKGDRLGEFVSFANGSNVLLISDRFDQEYNQGKIKTYLKSSNTFALYQEYTFGDPNYVPPTIVDEIRYGVVYYNKDDNIGLISKFNLDPSKSTTVRFRLINGSIVEDNELIGPMQPANNALYIDDNDQLSVINNEVYNVVGTGGVSFNSTTKVLTLSGTKSQINDMLNSLIITATTSNLNTIDLSYRLNEGATSTEIYTRVQRITKI